MSPRKAAKKVESKAKETKKVEEKEKKTTKRSGCKTKKKEG